MVRDGSPPPLPFSTSASLHPRVRTFEQWQSALKEVKVYYLKRQYKQCAAYCAQLLDEAENAGTVRCLYALCCASKADSTDIRSVARYA